MCSRTAVLAAMLAIAPLGANAADLVVWWEKGYNPEEDVALRDTVAAFELESGKKVDLSFHVQMQMASELQAALDAGHPPDLAYSIWAFPTVSRWAYEGRLVDLADAVERSTATTCLTVPPAGAAFSAWQSRAPQTASMFGPACSGKPVSGSPTSPSNGTRSGPSGAAGCNRRCAAPRAVRTSGAWA